MFKKISLIVVCAIIVVAQLPKYGGSTVGGGGGGGSVNSVTAGPSGLITVTGTTANPVVDGDTNYIMNKQGTNVVSGYNDYTTATTMIPQPVVTSFPGTGALGQMILRSDYSTLYQSYNTDIYSGIAGARGKFGGYSFEEEFCGSGGNYKFQWGSQGSLSDTSVPLSDANHPCVDNVSATGANSVGAVVQRYNATGGNAGFGIVGGLDAATGEFHFIFRPNASTQVIYRVGMMDNWGSGLPSNGVFMQYSNNSGCTTTASDTSWVYHTRSAGTSSTATGATFGVSTWIHLRIRSVTPGTWLFSTSTNGGAFSTEQALSTNVPSARLAPIFQLLSCEAAYKFVFFDYVSMEMYGMAR